MRTELLRRLLAATDSIPRGRAELLDISGIAENEWRTLIVELISLGWVEQLGDRRTAEYVRVIDSVPPGSAVPKSARVASKLPESHPAPTTPHFKLLAAMDDSPRSRADLTARAGIDPEQWPGAIWHLMQSNDVHKVGDKGGARYFRVSPTDQEDADYQGQHAVSPVRFSAHQDLEDVLRELGVFEDAESTDGAEPIDRSTGEVPLYAASARADVQVPEESATRSLGLLSPLALSANKPFSAVGPLTQGLSATPGWPREDFKRAPDTAAPPPLPVLERNPEPPRRPALSQPSRTFAPTAQESTIDSDASSAPDGPPPLPRIVQARPVREDSVTRWDPGADTPPPLPLTSYLQDIAARLPAVQPVQMPLAFRSRLGHEVIDKRSAGGCLWIIDTPSASDYVKWLNLGGAQFVFAGGGGRVTDFRAAWWTKDPNVVLYPVSINYMGAHVIVYSMLHGSSPVTEDAGKIKLLVDAEVLLPGPVIWRPERPIPVPCTTADTAADVPALAHAVAVFLSYLVHPFDRSASVNSWAPEMNVYLAACEHFGFAMQRPRELVGTGSADFTADALLASTWTGAWSSR